MNAILAMDPHRVIGHHGRIPWYYSDDFKWFKRATTGGSLLMGRTTFESIGKPLPGRYTYILTNDRMKQLLPPGELCCYVSGDWMRTRLNDFPDLAKKLWLCGGARVYKEFLHLCESVYVTHIMEEYEGDTFMPEFESMFPNGTVIQEHPDFWVAQYWK